MFTYKSKELYAVMKWNLFILKGLPVSRRYTSLAGEVTNAAVNTTRASTVN